MMHTTARADCKDCRQRKRYAKAGWKGSVGTTVRGLCFSYGRQFYCDESLCARRPVCPRKSTSHQVNVRITDIVTGTSAIQRTRWVGGETDGRITTRSLLRTYQIGAGEAGVCCRLLSPHRSACEASRRLPTVASRRLPTVASRRLPTIASRRWTGDSRLRIHLTHHNRSGWGREE